MRTDNEYIARHAEKMRQQGHRNAPYKNETLEQWWQRMDRRRANVDKFNTKGSIVFVTASLLFSLWMLFSLQYSSILVFCIGSLILLKLSHVYIDRHY